MENVALCVVGVWRGVRLCVHERESINPTAGRAVAIFGSAAGCKVRVSYIGYIAYD